MYESYYGFKANPFRIAPDPSFFFASAGHKRGLAYLRYGLHQGQGFVVVTGEPGTGKTMLVQTLLAELSSQEYCIAMITNTNLRAEDVLRSVAENFGIDQRAAKNKAELLSIIQDFLVAQHTAGKKSLLVVDEAQNLPPRSLEELRMLSNFQVGHQGLLQTVLSAQPQLRKTLAAPSMEQLSQRIIAGCHLKPISAPETRAYVAHRLQRVGWSGTPGFSGAAMSIIFQVSRGVPRLINMLVDRILLAACMDEKESIDEALVCAVLDELKQEGTGAWTNVDVPAVSAQAAEEGLAPLPEQQQPVARQASGGSSAAVSSPSPSRSPSAGSANVEVGRTKSVSSAPANEQHLDPLAPSSSVVKRQPQKESKPRPKIVKAVSAAAQGGQTPAAKLVQVKWPKEKESEPASAPRVDQPKASAAGQAAAKPRATKQVEASRPAVQQPSPGKKPQQAAPEAKPQPKQSRPQQAKPKPRPESEPKPKPKPKTKRSKVVELPLPKAKTPSRDELPKEDDFDELFEPVPPPMTAERAAGAEMGGEAFVVEADHELFGGGKSRSKSRPVMIISVVIGAVVLGAAVAYFMAAADRQQEPVPPATQGAGLASAGQSSGPVVAAQAPTPSADALQRGDEGERASIFDPRARVAVGGAAKAPEAAESGAAVAPGSAAVSEVAPSSPPSLPEWELADLMYTFILAYENGNVSLFTTLFAPDAVVDGYSGKDEISRYHATLFRKTEMRTISINDIKWSQADGYIKGEAQYEKTLWHQGQVEPDFSAGRVLIDVVRSEGRLQIRRVQFL